MALTDFNKLSPETKRALMQLLHQTAYRGPTWIGMDMARPGSEKTAFSFVERRSGMVHVATFDTVEEANAEIERIKRGAVDLELQPDGTYAPRKP